MDIDPLILRVISLAFALLFLFACAHKFQDRAHFRLNFEAYKIVPGSLSGMVTTLIPPLEFITGMGWLACALTGTMLATVSFLSIALLAAYSLAIAVNLARGRDHIDCGCSFSAAGFNSAGNGSQHISSGLIFRNAILILLAAISLFPTAGRNLHLVDYFAMVFASGALILLYTTFNQLLINRNAINSWRRSHA